jgi:uncharacterized protein YcfL
MKKVLLLTISTIFLASCGSQTPITESQQAVKYNISEDNTKVSELCYDYSSAYNEYG